MAGYSGTPQARKLGLTEGCRLWLDEPPQGWALTDPPPYVVVPPPEPVDVLVAFFRGARELGPRLPALAERIRPAGGLWVAWPRKAGGHVSDLSDALVRATCLELGIVDVKVAAIDDDWSGARFVWRLARR
jgi:hypothetical protein